MNTTNTPPLTRTEAITRALHFGFPHRHTHGLEEESIELTPSQRAAAVILAERIVKGEQTLVRGPLGRGKTFLACTIGFKWYERGRHMSNGKARYWTTTRLLQEIKNTFRRNYLGTDTLEVARDCGLLVLDQLIATHETIFERNTLTDLLDHRYNAMKPTILITNLDKEGLLNALDGPAVDRLFEGGKGIIVVEGESRRQGTSSRNTTHVKESI